MREIFGLNQHGAVTLGDTITTCPTTWVLPQLASSILDTPPHLIGMTGQQLEALSYIFQALKNHPKKSTSNLKYAMGTDALLEFPGTLNNSDDGMGNLNDLFGMEYSDNWISTTTLWARQEKRLGTWGPRLRNTLPSQRQLETS